MVTVGGKRPKHTHTVWRGIHREPKSEHIRRGPLREETRDSWTSLSGFFFFLRCCGFVFKLRISSASQSWCWSLRGGGALSLNHWFNPTGDRHALPPGKRLELLWSRPAQCVHTCWLEVQTVKKHSHTAFSLLTTLRLPLQPPTNTVAYCSTLHGTVHGVIVRPLSLSLSPLTQSQKNKNVKVQSGGLEVERARHLLYL